MAKTPTGPITATEQTKINAAPTAETTATMTREVETVDQPLVYNNGEPVETASPRGDDGEFTLYHPGGTSITVTSTSRRDALLARGYSTDRPERTTPDATVAVQPANA